MAITALSKFLKLNQTVEFTYNALYYGIFTSVESGYIINIYSSNEKDAYGEYQEKFNVDGGLCTGGVRDAILFMLYNRGLICLYCNNISHYVYCFHF